MKMKFIFLNMLLAICFSSEDTRLEAIRTIYEPMMRLEKSQPLRNYLLTCDADMRQPIQYQRTDHGLSHKFIWDETCGAIELIISEQIYQHPIALKATITLPRYRPISFEYTEADTNVENLDLVSDEVENLNLGGTGMMCGGRMAQDEFALQNAILEIYTPMLAQDANTMYEILGAFGNPTSYSTQVVAGINHIFTWNNNTLEVTIWQTLDGTYEATISDSQAGNLLVFTYSV